jgi:hypothetical protein
MLGLFLSCLSLERWRWLGLAFICGDFFLHSTIYLHLPGDWDGLVSTVWHGTVYMCKDRMYILASIEMANVGCLSECSG